MEFLSGSCAVLQPDVLVLFPTWESAVSPCLFSLVTCVTVGENICNRCGSL